MVQPTAEGCGGRRFECGGNHAPDRFRRANVSSGSVGAEFESIGRPEDLVVLTVILSAPDPGGRAGAERRQVLRQHAVAIARRRLLHMRDLTMVIGPSGNEVRSSSRRSLQASASTAA